MCLSPMSFQAEWDSLECQKQEPARKWYDKKNSFLYTCYLTLAYNSVSSQRRKKGSVEDFWLDNGELSTVRPEIGLRLGDKGDTSEQNNPRGNHSGYIGTWLGTRLTALLTV